MKKKLAIALILIGIIFVAAGCQDYYNTPLTPENADSDGLWTHYIVRPLSWFLKEVAKIFSGSYGMSIVVATILIRLALLPLMIKQTKSSKAMQEIQPEMKKLQEKYSSKDQQTQTKLREETMKLFQEHNVNPMASCFPIIVQMPILIAFYQAIRKTPGMQEHTFLWFDLGQADPILPIIAAGATFVQQKLMMGRMGNTNPQMAMMTYLMPIMIGVVGMFVPAALTLYWVVGNAFMIGQIFIIYREPVRKPEVNKPTGGSKK